MRIFMILIKSIFHYKFNLFFIYFNFFIFLVNLLIWEVKTLERKGWQLGGLLKESLLETDRHTKLVVNEPDGTDINDGHSLLSLLDTVEGNSFLLHVVSFWHKGTIWLGSNLELEGRWVWFLTWAHNRLVESFAENCDIELLTEPLLGVFSHGVDNDLIKFLQLVVKFHSIGVVTVKAEIKGIGRASSALVGESTQAIWGTHEGKLKVELFVVATVEVDGLTAILVLTEF